MEKFEIYENVIHKILSQNNASRNLKSKCASSGHGSCDKKRECVMNYVRSFFVPKWRRRNNIKDHKIFSLTTTFDGGEEQLPQLIAFYSSQFSFTFTFIQFTYAFGFLFWSEIDLLFLFIKSSFLKLGVFLILIILSYLTLW